MKVWRKTQAVFQEDNIEFTPSDHFTFIRQDDKKYLLPLGLVQYEMLANQASVESIMGSLVCFSGNKYIVNTKDLIHKLKVDNFDVASQLLGGLDLEETISLQELTSLFQSVVKVGGTIPNEVQRKEMEFSYKDLNPEVKDVARITLKFIHHMVDTKMVSALIDPNMASEVIKNYGEDRAHDQVL